MLVIILGLLAMMGASAFSLSGSGRWVRSRPQSELLTMEYIPDGLSKAQWEKMKAEEAKKDASKDLGKVGITKFKSRSFEAWQKDGQKHLFPVDPKTPLAERPYMQRTDGSWDGRDLKGVKGVKGQAAPMKFTDVDRKYEQMSKPAPVEEPKKVDAKIGGKVDAKATGKKPVEEPKKKGFFGLF